MNLLKKGVTKLEELFLELEEANDRCEEYLQYEAEVEELKNKYGEEYLFIVRTYLGI